MANTNESKAAQLLRKRSKGSYAKAKKTEAQAKGRSLPGGLEDAIGVITGAKLDVSKGGDPYVYIYATTEEPEEFKGISCGQIFMLVGDNYRSYDGAIENFVSAMKLLGLGDIIESANDESEAAIACKDYLDKNRIRFLFNTSNRTKKDGTHSTFIQGIAEGEVRREAQAPRKQASPFAEGDSVGTSGDFFEDGDDYTGTVLSVDTENGCCNINFDDDGSISDVPFGNLRLLETETEEPQTSSDTPFEVDDIVEVFDFYDDTYTGTVASISIDAAVIAFEDGTEEEISLEHIRLNTD